jgi:hypothetical protein
MTRVSANANAENATAGFGVPVASILLTDVTQKPKNGGIGEHAQKI